jgi:hypothetical protein
MEITNTSESQVNTANNQQSAVNIPQLGKNQIIRRENYLPEALIKNAADDIWSIITPPNFSLAANERYVLPLNESYFVFPGAKSPTHAQIEAMRHVYSGPNKNLESFMVQIGTAPNAFINGRLIISHIPPVYSVDEIKTMTPYQLSQFPCMYHSIRGDNTVFQTRWALPTPHMYAFDPKYLNGYIVVAFTEFNSSEQATKTGLTVWVSTSKQSYFFPCGVKEFSPPVRSQLRFKHRLDTLKEELSDKIQDSLSLMDSDPNMKNSELKVSLELVLNNL